MTGLVRTVNFTEQPLRLVAHQPAPAASAVEPEPFAAYAEEAREQRQASVAEPVAAEPRFTYEEFMQCFEPELKEAKERAIEEGLAQGKAQGREQGAAEYEAELARLRELIASARAALDQGIEGVADMAVEIVYEAVAKIIGARMLERDAAVSSVREVIRKAKERSQLVARVSPHDFEMINGDRARLIEGLNVGDVDIVADDRVRLGGCLLETPAGNLDGRL